MFNIGEIAAATATLSYVASAIVARRVLKRIPMGIFSIYRTAVGAAMYFALVSILQGPEQFQDLFSPVLLGWIWVYAIPVIVIGQLAWFFALKYARASDLSLATSVSPLAGIVFAMVLLGENPGIGFVPGATLILVAVCIGQMRDTTWQVLFGAAVGSLKNIQRRMVAASSQVALGIKWRSHV
ncbi:DMT family transporter [Roseovarius rhodophyticola]|uniref:DMT family transporter n=1 Tax=Roseovarius rhodophyticola TaxID=3080827 RepID=A0ABZ2TK16_9RHOB|nr:DMT family transporter [Roseovarius sp. W115]MDV2930298.1 DMT family transporter [Roseovarius sp. W115]